MKNNALVLKQQTFKLILYERVDLLHELIGHPVWHRNSTYLSAGFKYKAGAEM